MVIVKDEPSHQGAGRVSSFTANGIALKVKF